MIARLDNANNAFYFGVLFANSATIDFYQSNQDYVPHFIISQYVYIVLKIDTNLNYQDIRNNCLQ